MNPAVAKGGDVDLPTSHGAFLLCPEDGPEIQGAHVREGSMSGKALGDQISVHHPLVRSNSSRWHWCPQPGTFRSLAMKGRLEQGKSSRAT